MDVKDIFTQWEKLKTNRTQWEKVWIEISKYILPSRGVFYVTTKKPKRNLTPKETINRTAKIALNVLASGLHSGMTSPVRPWFRLLPQNQLIHSASDVAKVYAMNEKIIYEALRESAFYQNVHTFYLEFGGFCTAAMYVGYKNGQLQFETLTAGEYAFTLDTNNRPDLFIRQLFKRPDQIVDEFGEKAPEWIVDKAKNGVIDYYPILHAVWKEKNGNFNYKSAYVLGMAGPDGSIDDPLSEGGFYEMPYFVARWEALSGDTYGVGPGFDAINDVKRLQDMEKTVSMAAHKAVDPPVNAPARRRGQIDTLPGGINYYSNPNEIVIPFQNVPHDFQGILAVIERTELRIQRTFYNDVFLTAVRNPNASPLKATEVNERSEERLIRLGPMIEALEHEFLYPLLQRVYNILKRNDELISLSPELEKQTGGTSVDFVSVLAQAQKMIAAGSIQNFLAFIGGAAQFNQEVLDVINSDNVVYEYGDITGVPVTIFRTPQEVQKIREQREQQADQARQQQTAAIMEQFKLELEKLKSEIAVNYARAGEQATAAFGQPTVPPQQPEMGGLP